MSFPARLSYGFAKEWGVVVMDDGAPVRVGVRSGAPQALSLKRGGVIGAPISIEQLSHSDF